MSSSLLLLTNPIARTWGSISCSLGYYTTEVLLLLTWKRRRRRRWRGWDFDPVKKKKTKITSHVQGKSQRNSILQAIKRERLGDGWCERKDRKIMHAAVGARGGTLPSDAIVRLFCPKSEQNAEWEGGSPSVPATSLSAHTRTFFGLNSLSLSGHKWQQQQHQQLFIFPANFEFQTWSGWS